MTQVRARAGRTSSTIGGVKVRWIRNAFAGKVGKRTAGGEKITLCTYFGRSVMLMAVEVAVIVTFMVVPWFVAGMKGFNP